MKERLLNLHDGLRAKYRKFKKASRARWDELPSFDTTRIALVAIGAFILLAMVYLMQSSSAAHLARDLRSKKVQIKQIKIENAQLRADIAALASPSAIEASAKELQLGPPKKVVYAEMPWIHPPVNELMPAFLPDGNFQTTPRPVAASEATVLEQLLSTLGLGNFSGTVNAQTNE